MDPLDLQRKKLARLCSEGEIAGAEAAIDQQVTESIKRAEQAPFPPPKELYEDVLA
jgi:TPP-dependent pyruvate/acetoin dehydrogenase alpha subunit